MAVSAVFAYNGSTTVTATITGAVDGDIYSLAVNADPGATDSGTVSGGTLVLTGTGISIADGVEFDTWVSTGSNPHAASADFVAATVFAGGSTAESGLTATWSFDGASTVSVTGAFTTGVAYSLQILDHAGGSTATSFTGTGASQTVSNSTDVTAVGNYFYAFVSEEVSFEAVANRLFSAGVSGSGFAGNPGGGADDDCELVLTPGSHPATSSSVAPVTLLGSGVGTDTVTVTLSAAIPGDGQIHVVFAQTSLEDPDSSGPGGPVAGSDLTGKTWITAAIQDSQSWPLVGLTKVSINGTSFLDALQVGSVARGCSVGDLSIGDTITIDFRDGTATTESIALAIYLPSTWGPAAGQLGGSGPFHITYGNGNDYPDLSPSDSRLRWLETEFVEAVEPDASSTMFTVMGAYTGATSFTPDLGSVIGSITSGNLFLASCITDDVEGPGIEPGGVFNASSVMLTGNYQFFTPAPVAGGGTDDDDDCNLDLEPEDEDCDLVLVPFASRDIGGGSSGTPGRSLLQGSSGISAGTFGSGGSVQQVLNGQTGAGTSGIVSAETFGVGGFANLGTGKTHVGADPGAGIPTAMAFGSSGIVTRGTGLLRLIGNAGIAPGTFGTTGKIIVTVKGSAGITSGQAFGTTGIVQRTVGIHGVTGIVSAGAFGSGGKAVQIVKGSAGISAGAFGSGGAVFRPGAGLVDNHLLLGLTWQA